MLVCVCGKAKDELLILPAPGIRTSAPEHLAGQFGVESSAMDTAKNQVQKILEILPEDASLEDIQYHIYVRQMIEQGLADVEAGRVIPHEEVERRLAKWRAK